MQKFIKTIKEKTTLFFIKFLTHIQYSFAFLIGLYNKIINKKCLFIVISGPPAIGKNTVCDILLKKLKQNNIKVNFIKSYTTRGVRNDNDSNNYNFISEKEFKNKIKKNEMLEYVINPNNQHYYGFALSDIKYSLLLRKISITIPTYNFLLNLNKYLKYKNIKYCEIVSIFLLPNSMNDIKERIKLRGSEDKAEIKRRINNADTELKTAQYYDIKLVNKKSLITANTIQNIILKKLKH